MINNLTEAYKNYIKQVGDLNESFLHLYTMSNVMYEALVNIAVTSDQPNDWDIKSPAGIAKKALMDCGLLERD